ncbi:sugar phosphate nucleotidyltransferase [Candidatus Protochlamydia phocaeensis]|uniref:sugar phosphate nucleotidyltransferase n=1 Tax=Candidatus Protochlamydia phocaeensis TaxID=1414722 RepID=UPI0009AD8E01|nr:sugar phosphate nucleotidyltransferase [Candidatus Protochlamydia phocaeensis]
MATLTVLDQLMTRRTNSPDPALSVDMKLVASLILSGGEGTRLYPLTLTRCKPAINFGGKYRLIDVPISNSIHADCHKIFVLTQFLSSSLHHHIFQTYMQGGRASEMIEILTAEQRPTHKNWFQGTADAVRQNMDYLLECPVEYFLILSGDQLYNINFREMVLFAKKTDADVVIAALPVTAQEATRMGVLKINENDFITDFYEKPQEKELLQKLRSPSETLERAGVNPASKRHHLGSMGIYLFKRKALVDLLMKDPREDFGKHLIPTKVQSGQAAAFLYDGYWEDIGTIETFYQANMALTESNPKFSFHNELRPIFTSRYDLPPAKFFQTQIDKSLLCEGAIVEADEVTHSLLGPRTMIRKGSIIRDTYIMGNDYYISTVSDHHRLPPAPHIGENCLIKRAIIDKNVHIGHGVQLINKQNLTHYNGENIFIRDGIIIVPRGATLPDGFIL